MIREVEHITRKMLRDSPDTLFVFGDNMNRIGFGGQAREMRGEPNAVGIPTKWYPAIHSKAFFTDADLLKVKAQIDEAFSRITSHLAAGGEVIWPKAGVGTGLADLKNRAPKIWAYIEGMREGLNKC